MERAGAVFECVVVDNTCFWKTGRIKIRICKSTSIAEGAEDFSINPKYSRNYNKENFGGNEDENLEGDGIIDHDDYAELSTCIGGAGEPRPCRSLAAGGGGLRGRAGSGHGSR